MKLSLFPLLLSLTLLGCQVPKTPELHYTSWSFSVKDQVGADLLYEVYSGKIGPATHEEQWTEFDALYWDCKIYRPHQSIWKIMSVMFAECRNHSDNYTLRGDRTAILQVACLTDRSYRDYQEAPLYNPNRPYPVIKLTCETQ